MKLPSRPIFVDVETTGLHSDDRVVSLGAVLLDMASLSEPQFRAHGVHLVFDPGKKCHPRAEDVHGWSDWMLRHQDPFEQHASSLAKLFDQADCIVAHNAAFDWRFIANEFALVGRAAPAAPCFCTMIAWRNQVGGRAGLNNVLAQMGLRRTSERHGAFEDAWFAMRVFLHLHGLPHPNIAVPGLEPSNQREVPPLPDGPLPRRKHRQQLSGELETPPVQSGGRAQLIVATKAMATILMWVARCDGALSEAIDILEAMIRDEAMHRGIVVDDAVLQGVAATFADLEPTEAMLDVAVRALSKEDGARARLGNWMNMTTDLDGQGSDEERVAIAKIAKAYVDARSA